MFCFPRTRHGERSEMKAQNFMFAGWVGRDANNKILSMTEEKSGAIIYSTN